MRVERRERASDTNAEPLVWYVYILEIEDGDFYIGQTNDLKVRLAEHAIGAGAERTSGKKPRLVWVNMATERAAAKRMEARLQRAKNRNPEEVRKVVADFKELIRMVKPDKTLAELEEEQRDYESEMDRAFHHVPLTVASLGGIRRASCGWYGASWNNYAVYGTNDWKSLAADAEKYDTVKSLVDEDAARRVVHGRPPCRRCLAIMPSTEECT